MKVIRVEAATDKAGAGRVSPGALTRRRDHHVSQREAGGERLK